MGHLRIVYRGNFQPGEPDPWSTETEVALALEDLGHTVLRCQESERSWEETVAMCHGADVFLWTRTGSMDVWPHAHEAVAELNRSLRTVGLHLDRWWGLSREHQITESAFFRLSEVWTADGDHDDDWRRAGVNHRWLRPAVGVRHCWMAPVRVEVPVVFVGSWRNYHAEWREQRRRLVAQVVRLGGEVVSGGCRNACLNHLFSRSAAVAGDCCLADRSRRYWSDRVTETAGRGGVLVHRFVEGVAEILPEGTHAFYWHDLDELAAVVRWVVAHETEAARVRERAMATIRAEHTWQVRMREVLA